MKSVLTRFQRSDRKYLSFNLEHQIRNPLDIFGGVGKGEAMLADPIEVQSSPHSAAVPACRRRVSNSVTLNSCAVPCLTISAPWLY
jgi:hypothetical protein